MSYYLRSAEAAQRLGVCPKMIRRWDATGKIHCIRTVGGHRRISILEIARLTQQGYEQPKANREVAIYCRVSSHEQKKKGDLARQVAAAKTYCHQQGYGTPRVFQDIASGLNAKRKGLIRLCQLIEQGTIDRVVLTYPDRLTRFGLDSLQHYFRSHGTAIEVLNTPMSSSIEAELVHDMIALITSFSGRVHGLRGQKNRHKQRQQKARKNPAAPHRKKESPNQKTRESPGGGTQVKERSAEKQAEKTTQGRETTQPKMQVKARR
jgi:putative resolvase